MTHDLALAFQRLRCSGARGVLILRWLSRRLHLWLGAIRDAYVTLLPMTIVGALALGLAELPPLVALLRHLELPASDLMQAAKLFFNATFGIMGLLGAMAIAAAPPGCCRRRLASTGTPSSPCRRWPRWRFWCAFCPWRGLSSRCWGMPACSRAS